MLGIYIAPPNKLSIERLTRHTGLEEMVLKDDDFSGGSPVELGYALIDMYQLDLLNALVRALGHTLVEETYQPGQYGASPEAPAAPTSHVHAYARDPALIIPQEKLMLLPDVRCSDTKHLKDFLPIGPSRSFFNGARELQDHLPVELGYNVVQMRRAYVEGGNTLYFPKHRLVLHGSNPGGFYQYSDYSREASLERYARALDKAAKIQVLGLEINEFMLADALQNKFYHLDCFMHELNDGRVIILNKDFLTRKSGSSAAFDRFIETQNAGKPTSYEKLVEAIGKENIIDLGFPMDGFKYEIPLFNALSTIDFSGDGRTKLILPREVIENGVVKDDFITGQLADHNLDVITTLHLDARKIGLFNRDIAGRVAIELEKMGYMDVHETSLMTNLPQKESYLFDNGQRVNGKAVWPKAKGANFVPLQDYFAEVTCDFRHLQGGPHCRINCLRQPGSEKKSEEVSLVFVDPAPRAGAGDPDATP